MPALGDAAELEKLAGLALRQFESTSSKLVQHLLPSGPQISATVPQGTRSVLDPSQVWGSWLVL